MVGQGSVFTCGAVKECKCKIALKGTRRHFRRFLLEYLPASAGYCSFCPCNDGNRSHQLLDSGAALHRCTGGKHKTKAHVGVAFPGLVPVAISRANVSGPVVPATTTIDTVRALI